MATAAAVDVDDQRDEPADDYLTADDESILYEDDYIQVSRDGLRIKRYWFPALNSTFIPWHTIEYVKTAREANVKWYEVKDWGPAFGNICWALKPRLITRKQAGNIGFNSLDEIRDSNIVVKVRGKWMRPGTYVEYPHEAMRMIRRMVASSHLHAE
ncbi:hypothetical protein DL89DRAFT_289785 [Linderina pennispora]|uniref:Uncharacterized protein n=1 Tax=Linderina pennispora TaxID=61395 RepID=A0A1Y1WLV5_9FUNG|nr:uncharacterized protein DL89DRAFT_289785 [Linderina pennispora]ORX74166.1 hypothetical protein DL89DRAFT_289785 [Linderina pennispora]